MVSGGPLALWRPGVGAGLGRFVTLAPGCVETTRRAPSSLDRVAGPRYASAMEKIPLVGESERRTLEILEGVLAGTPYRAFSKVRIEDVLRAEAGDNLWPGEQSMLARGHFDFVVYKGPSMHPTFAVEFDGPQHDREPQSSRDRCKNRLCWRAELPLLRITQAEIAPHERISILEYMLLRFLAWAKELPSIEAEIRDRSPRLEPEELAELDPSVIEDLADDPMFDPTVVFDITHGYPGNDEIARRLLDRFGIEVAQAPAPGSSSTTRPRSVARFFRASCRGRGTMSCEALISSSSSTALAGRNPSAGPTTDTRPLMPERSTEDIGSSRCGGPCL